MCCGGKLCRILTCLILLAVVIGLLFGFGVFTHGFNKLKSTIHYTDPHHSLRGRPFFFDNGAPIRH